LLLEAQERNQELMHKVEESASKIVLLEDSVKRFNIFSYKYCEIQTNFPLSVILLFFVHRLEESTADKDSLLAIERHGNSETKKELAGSQKKIEELLTEVQDTRTYIAELEESVRRSVICPYRGVILLSILTSVH
jgi:myosin-5